MVSVAWILGSWLSDRRLLHLHNEPVLTLGLGLGGLGQLLFFLGWAGLLVLPVIVGLFCVITAVGLWRLVESSKRGMASIRLHPFLWLGGSTLALAPLTLALYPPFTFDATLYHLPFTRAFAETGSLPFLPSLRFPIFPQLAEVTSVPAFLLSSDVGAKLLQALYFGLTAALLAAWGQEIQSPSAGRWAAALWLGTPLALWIGCSAYVDAGLTFFVTAGCYAWNRFRPNPEPRQLLLTGVFLGFAAATKYLALFFIGFLGLWILANRLRAAEPNRAIRAIRAAALFSLGVLLIAAPWYVRIYAATGSPLFPFYEPIFGAGPWTSFHDQVALETADVQTVSGLQMLGEQAERIFEGLGFLISVPWRAVFDRAAFHWQAPLSPFLMVLLPVGLPFVWLRPKWRAWLMMVLCYGLFWLTTVRDLRFLMVILPLLYLMLSVGLEGAIERLPDRWVRRIPWLSPNRLATLFTVVLITPGWAYAGYKMYELGPIPTPTSREAFLTRQWPGLEALTLLNDSHGREYVVYGLFTENLRYFADGLFIGDWAGPQSFEKVIPLLHDGPSLHRRLRDFGADFLLVAPDAGPFPPDAHLPPELFEPMLDRPTFKLYRLASR